MYMITDLTMSSNHLSIEPAPPENAHNHHSSLIEGCRLCYPSSYSQGREDGIRELYNLYGEPRCEYLHHPRSTQHRASEECPVEKRIKLLLNQKQS